MTIKSQLLEKEFIQVSLILMYSRPATRTIAILAFVFLCVAVSGFIAAPERANPLSILVPLAMLTALPLSVYISSRKAYKTIAQLRESVLYSMDDNSVMAKGETYDITYAWNDIFKVTATRNWVFIWQDKQRALPLARKDFPDLEIAGLKDILDRNNVKNNLKTAGETA